MHFNRMFFEDRGRNRLMSDNFEKKTVFVTGGAGFVGSNLVRL